MAAAPSLGLSFAFAASLSALVESATASLGKDARILHFTVEALEREIEGLTRSD
jgi:hypothetical protein